MIRFLSKLFTLLASMTLLCCVSNQTPTQEVVEAKKKTTESLVLETIEFAGYEWIVKNGYCSVGNTTGPGPNYWCGDEEDLWVDAYGRLHMKMNYKSALSHYGCVSIKTQVSGCGMYKYTVVDGTNGTPDAFDENVVLGLFTYESSAPEHDYYEIDIEITDWKDSTPDANLWYVTWEDESSTYDDFLLTFGTGAVDHNFTWQPSAITFTSIKNDVLLADGVRTGSDVYPCPAEPIYARINFWLADGEDPASPQEVIIEDFEFIPFVILNTPTGLSADADGENTIDLAWTDTSSGELGTQIERKTSGGEYSLIDTADPEAVDYEDTGLSAGTTYIYRVRAAGDGVYSDYSSEAQDTTEGTADAGINDPTLSEIDWACNGWNGYVSGEIDNMPEGSWHVRTWIKSSKWWAQGKDLSPDGGEFYATHGLWCTPGPGVDIYVALYNATTDEYGTGDHETMELGEWPDGHDYLFGPFATQ